MAGPSGSTSKYTLPYPISSDTTDVPRDIQALAARIETVLGSAGAVSGSNLNTIVTDGKYYAASGATGNPTGQAAIVEHTTSSDGTGATQFLQTVTGSSPISAFRAKTGATAGSGGTWANWTFFGSLPATARGTGAADFPASGTGSTVTRNVWGLLNTSSAVATFVTPLKCRALVTYSAWLTIKTTNDFAQDIRIFPRITVPGGTNYGISTMPATTVNVPGVSLADVLWLGQDDAGAGVFQNSGSSSASFVFDFPAGTSTVTLYAYRYFPAGAGGSSKVSFAKVSVNPLQYIP